MNTPSSYFPVRPQKESKKPPARICAAMMAWLQKHCVETDPQKREKAKRLYEMYSQKVHCYLEQETQFYLRILRHWGIELDVEHIE